MICKKLLRDGPTLTITNLAPESSVWVCVKRPPPNVEPIFNGKSCKREGRDLKIKVPANEKIIVRVRKTGLLPFEQTISARAEDQNATLSVIQTEDNYIFTIHAQDCTGPSKVDRRTIGVPMPNIIRTSDTVVE